MCLSLVKIESYSASVSPDVYKRQVQVTDFRLDAERDEQPPATNPKEQLLGEAQLLPTAIKLAGDPSTSRDVRRVITVQQVELYATDLDLPGAQPDRVAGQSNLEPEPFAVRLA